MKTEKPNSPVSSDINEKIITFDDLLKDVVDLDPKLRHLWSEIYHNAIVDRRYARLAYEDLIQKILTAAENHGLYGDKLAKYLERMGKANDQLLLLSKYIDDHQTVDKNISSDDLYDKFGS